MLPLLLPSCWLTLRMRLHCKLLPRRLPLMMRLEADRMVNLQLSDAEVLPEDWLAAAPAFCGSRATLTSRSTRTAAPQRAARCATSSTILPPPR